MNTQTLDGLVKTASLQWTPLVESGVDTTGISVKSLRTEPATGRAVSFVLRFEPGAKYPYRDHPAGEEPLVLSGSCVIEGAMLETGDLRLRGLRPQADRRDTSQQSAVVSLRVGESVP